MADGTITSGEVYSWNDSSNTLKLVHVGNDSGKFTNLVTGIAVLGNDSRAYCTPTSVTEGIESTKTEMNDQFETTATDMSFLDFTESNPCGDVQ